MVTVYAKGDAETPADARPFACPDCGAEYAVHDPDGVRGATLQFDFQCKHKDCRGGTDGKRYKAGVGLA